MIEKSSLLLTIVSLKLGPEVKWTNKDLDVETFNQTVRVHTFNNSVSRIC